MRSSARRITVHFRAGEQRGHGDVTVALEGLQLFGGELHSMTPRSMARRIAAAETSRGVRPDRRRGLPRCRAVPSACLRRSASRSPARSRDRPPRAPCSRSARPAGSSCPCARIFRMVPNRFCTISGARPSEGSSSSSSFGFAIRPRATASICCWPPESVQPSACLERLDLGEDAELLVGLLLQLPARHALAIRRAQQDVLAHRQAGENAPALRHVADAQPRDRFRAEPLDRLAFEQHFALRGHARAPRWSSASCSCRRHWRRAA